MTLSLIMPDIVKMMVAFLRAQAEVVAVAGAATSIRGKLGQGITYPAVRVTRITSETIQERPFFLEAVRVQFDCFGGNNRQAERLAQAVRSALTERGVGYSNTEGVVTKVRPINMSDSPDDAFDPDRERYIVEMEVWVRPK